MTTNNETKTTKISPPAERGSTPKIAFEVGKVCHVWETKGCRELKSGPSSSERKGGEYADIEPSERLLVLKKLGSTGAIVQREDGTQIHMHLNHINPSSSYYALRGAKVASAKPVAQQVSEAKAKLEALQKEMEALLMQQLEAEDAEKETVSDEARAEAEALFAMEAEEVENAVEQAAAAG